MNWNPFVVAASGSRGDLPRSIDTFEGKGDRLRSAAFAEIQAREAFLWAAEHYTDASPELKAAWRELAEAEDKHLRWLMTRMKELGVPIEGRTVSDQLWHSLLACPTAKDFTIYMASAEERGRKAGVRFHEVYVKTDPVTAEIFGQIAKEEVEHIELARRFFDWVPGMRI